VKEEMPIIKLGEPQRFSHIKWLASNLLTAVQDSPGKAGWLVLGWLVRVYS